MYEIKNSIIKDCCKASLFSSQLEDGDAYLSYLLSSRYPNSPEDIAQLRKYLDIRNKKLTKEFLEIPETKKNIFLLFFYHYTKNKALRPIMKINMASEIFAEQISLILKDIQVNHTCISNSILFNKLQKKQFLNKITNTSLNNLATQI